MRYKAKMKTNDEILRNLKEQIAQNNKILNN